MKVNKENPTSLRISCSLFIGQLQMRSLFHPKSIGILISPQKYILCVPITHELHHGKKVLAYANSKSSDEPVHQLNFGRTYAVHSCKQYAK